MKVPKAGKVPLHHGGELLNSQMGLILRDYQLWKMRLRLPASKKNDENSSVGSSNDCINVGDVLLLRIPHNW